MDDPSSCSMLPILFRAAAPATLIGLILQLRSTYGHLEKPRQRLLRVLSALICCAAAIPLIPLLSLALLALSVLAWILSGGLDDLWDSLGTKPPPKYLKTGIVVTVTASVLFALILALSNPSDDDRERVVVRLQSCTLILGRATYFASENGACTVPFSVEVPYDGYYSVHTYPRALMPDPRGSILRRVSKSLPDEHWREDDCRAAARLLSDQLLLYPECPAEWRKRVFESVLLQMKDIEDPKEFLRILHDDEPGVMLFIYHHAGASLNYSAEIPRAGGQHAQSYSFLVFCRLGDVPTEKPRDLPVTGDGEFGVIYGGVSHEEQPSAYHS